MDVTLPKITDELDLFTLSMRSRKLSPMTVTSYLKIVRLFARQMDDPDPRAVTRTTVQTFLATVGADRSPATVALYHAGLRAFFRWLADEENIPDPTAGLKQPKVPLARTEVLTRAELKSLLGAYRGRDFYGRRNRAIVSLFIDSGMRLSELTNLVVDQVNLRSDPAEILNIEGKGRKRRTIAITAEAAGDLGSYLRLRRDHSRSYDEHLWLGHLGPLTTAGVWKVVRTAGRKCGINLHPHQFRHSYASHWLEAGGGEIDLINHCGWSNTQMLRRYGAAAGEHRAKTAHAKFSVRSQL